MGDLMRTEHAIRQATELRLALPIEHDPAFRIFARFEVEAAGCTHVAYHPISRLADLPKRPIEWSSRTAWGGRDAR